MLRFFATHVKEHHLVLAESLNHHIQALPRFANEKFGGIFTHPVIRSSFPFREGRRVGAAREGLV